MLITVLKSKIHRATVTESNLDYVGSCTIDGAWLDQVGIRENEQIDIYNVTNGERLTTYAIRGEPGSQVICLNGSAAHKAKPGHKVIICSYAMIDSLEYLVPRILTL